MKHLLYIGCSYPIYESIIVLFFSIPLFQTTTKEQITNGKITFIDFNVNPVTDAIKISGTGIPGGYHENINSINWAEIPNAIIDYNVFDKKGLSMTFRINKNSPDGIVMLEDHGLNELYSIDIPAPGEILKYAEIRTLNVSFADADITFLYKENEITNIDENNLSIYIFDKYENTWKELPVKIDENNNTISSTVDVMSVFALGPHIQGVPAYAINKSVSILSNNSFLTQIENNSRKQEDSNITGKMYYQKYDGTMIDTPSTIQATPDGYRINWLGMDYGVVWDGTHAYDTLKFPNGTYLINASLTGYTTNSTTRTINGSNTTNANISLSPLWILSGYITNASSGAAITGATVTTNTSLNTTSNATGFYNFSLSDGTYIITANLTGYYNNSITKVINVSNITDANISLTSIGLVGANCTGASILINVTALNSSSSIHKNLNNQTSATVDPNNKRCWACHGNGTQPVNGSHTGNYLTPYACANCHNATYNLSYTNSSVISYFTTRKVYDHVQQPYYQEINSTLNSSNATCIGCHNNSKVNYTDSGNSMASNVSHYASRTNLISPTNNCLLCHKNTTNASTYWANVTRHPAKSQNLSFCANCHNNTNATDFHDPGLSKANVQTDLHRGFDWKNNDTIEGPNPSEGCTVCHTYIDWVNFTMGYNKCEDCHLENARGPLVTVRPDINSTMPRVYAHTNFSTEVNVPNQSNVYPLSTKPSSCWSGNASGTTCHGNPESNKGQNGGYYAFLGAFGVSALYHFTITIDRLPNTTNCLFCHKQTNTTIRKAWGNATQIDGGTHTWYTGNDTSQCWGCHVSTGLAPQDFHSNDMTHGGSPDCLICHDLVREL